MAEDITEEQFRKNGAELFAKLTEEAKSLEVDRVAFEDSVKLIEEGRSLLAQSSFPESLAKYKEARNRITAAISIRAEPLATRLLWTQMGYLLIILAIGYATLKWPDCPFWKGIINQSLQTAWFGALGGITIAIYGIYSHVQKKDFDPRYKLWYLCKPVIGAVFGWFVYLIFFLGLVSVQGLGQDKMARPELPFLIAFLAGFSERFTIKMIDKLMSVLITWEDKKGGT